MGCPSSVSINFGLHLSLIVLINVLIISGRVIKLGLQWEGGAGFTMDIYIYGTLKLLRSYIATKKIIVRRRPSW